MYRWHAERNLMLRRWRHEIAIHGGHDGWRLPEYSVGVGLEAPIPPITCDSPPCHCYAGPGFFRKRKPLDCGRTKCGVCHGSKFFLPKARAAKKRAAIEYEILAG